MRHQQLIILLMVVLLSSCSIAPEAIVYGSDGCHFCKMTIVDKIHGAEIVTDKGKVYKFDAIECMVNFDKEIDAGEKAMYLVNHYESPEELINAQEAIFLISKRIPSPMGAFLTAFKKEESAMEIIDENEGKLYVWEVLVKHLNE
ncbi:MAG: nitrous oxide reductase accessory protein NosL [Cellulophaga sp.]